MATETEHGLLCLGEEEFAAIALAIQADAIAVDTALDSISDSLDTRYVRPYLQMVTTTGNGPLSSGGEQQFSIGIWSVAAGNIPIVSGTLLGNIAPMTMPRTGWYEYGCFVNLVAAGALTAFSRRTLTVSAYSRPASVAILQSQIVWRTAETSTAGEYLTASGGTFYATAGQFIELVGTWSHTNLASNVSSIVGAKAWVHWIGSGIEIGSA
jgi:hypothetical protein